jgi:hypothetical protein
MKKLTIEVIRDFNECYDYNLKDNELENILKELSDGYPVSENDIIELLEEYVS